MSDHGDVPAPPTEPPTSTAGSPASPAAEPAAPIVKGLESAREKEPEAPTVRSMSELQKAGVELALRVIALIGVVAALLLGIIAASELLRTPPEVATVERLLQQTTACGSACSEEAMKRASELLTRIVEFKRGSRDFWISLSQLLLLNLLLPVLTAILGYVFGQMKN